MSICGDFFQFSKFACGDDAVVKDIACLKNVSPRELA
jgi:hypothetical protein